MASAKLANTNSHLFHPLYHQQPPLHHAHYFPLTTVRSPDSAIGEMTLDYSLPNRSRLGDSDPSELPSLITKETHTNSNQSDDAFSNAAEAASPQCPSSPAGSDNPDQQAQFETETETPTRKNKRKLSEPKRRTDFKMKRLFSDAENVENQELDRTHAVIDSLESVTSFRSDSSLRPSSSSSSASLSTSNSLLLHKNKRCSSPDDQNHRILSSSPTSSAATSLSKCFSEDQESTPPATSLSNGTPTHGMHPLLTTGFSPATFGFLPVLYFSGQQFARTPLSSTFPSAIPLGLHQKYINDSANIAPHSGISVSDASSSQFLNNTSNSNKSESSPHFANEISPQSVFMKSLQSHGSSNKSTILPSSSVQTPIPSSLSSPPSPSSSQYNHSKYIASTSDNLNDDDDDDTLSQVHSPEDFTLGVKMSRKQRKNYKNMTRERRVEANARERTRVHTISAAFEALRRAVPSYSYNQKLSKLAILRIACSYIMSLARLADLDYTSPSEHIQKPLSFAECVDMCTSTIQTEGRARRRH